MIEPGQQLHAGDILRNDWAGKGNTYKYTMYLKRGQISGMKAIVCIGYDGRTTGFYEHDNRLVVVGHLKEYDAYKNALAQLRTKMDGDYNEEH